MLYPVLIIILSLILTYVGANFMLKGSIRFALHAGLGSLISGLTIVSIASSSPFLFLGAGSALINQGDIVVGSVMGSILFNIFITLGFASLINPLNISLNKIKIDLLLLLGSEGLFFMLFTDRRIDRVEGSLLLIILCLYIVLNLYLAKKGKNKEKLTEFNNIKSSENQSAWLSIGLMILGILLMVAGSKLLINETNFVSEQLGIGKTTAAMTLIAALVSLPQLTISVLAARRKEYDIAVGNVIGSGIILLLGVIGASAVLNPIRALAISNIDFYALIAATLLLIPFLRRKYSLKKDEGIFMLLLYGIYLYYLWPK
jgi:cation:H+ antiporter